MLHSHGNPTTQRNHRIVIKVVLTTICLATLTAFLLYYAYSKQAQPIPEHLKNMGGDFTLDTAQGPISLTDLSGKVVLMYFGYTHCPDICPNTLTNWRHSFDKLTEEERANVRGLLVSVDPVRDNVNVLEEYTKYFHANIVGATASIQTLEQVALKYRADFVIHANENHSTSEETMDTDNKPIGTSSSTQDSKSDTRDDLNYSVDHTSFVYVIGPDGKLRGLLNHDSSPAHIVEAIRDGFKLL